MAENTLPFHSWLAALAIVEAGVDKLRGLSHADVWILLRFLPFQPQPVSFLSFQQRKTRLGNAKAVADSAISPPYSVALSFSVKKKGGGRGGESGWMDGDGLRKEWMNESEKSVPKEIGGDGA